MNLSSRYPMPPKIKYFSRCANWASSNSTVNTRARICWMLLRRCSISSDGVMVSISDWFSGGVLARLEGGRVVGLVNRTAMTTLFPCSPMKTIYAAEVILVVLSVDRVNGPGHSGPFNVLLLVLSVQRIRLRGHLGIIGCRREMVVGQNDGTRWCTYTNGLTVR